jgi:hypothetical protein
MSGLEGAEREDYDECEAGVGRTARTSTTKGTKDHEGNWYSVGLTRGVVPVEY